MNSYRVPLNIWHRLLLWIVPICVAFSILSIAVMFVVYGKWIYYIEIDLLHIPEISGMDKAEIIRNYDALITYLSPFYSGELHFPSLAMSEGGRIHFVDVKNILVTIQYVMCVTIVISVVGIFSLMKKKREKVLLYSAVVTLLFPVVLLLPIAINFEKSFVLFHELLFQNDYWIFDPNTDPVIRMLPEEFFMHAACIILFIVLLGSVFCYWLYRAIKKKRN